MTDEGCFDSSVYSAMFMDLKSNRLCARRLIDDTMHTTKQGYHQVVDEYPDESPLDEFWLEVEDGTHGVEDVAVALTHQAVNTAARYCP